MWMTARRRADECGLAVEDVERAILADRAAVLERLMPYIKHRANCRETRMMGECSCEVNPMIAEILERPNDNR